MNIVNRAIILAAVAHARINQRRKYTNEYYITHPMAVADIVSSVPHTDEMIAAAWLHDVVEDTEISLDEIHRVFESKVCELVEMLTDISKPEDGNRAQRKAIDKAHTASASPEAKTIKLADLIDNLYSIIEHDQEFAKVYMEEKRLLLEVLKEGDSTLWGIANGIVEDYFKNLRVNYEQ